MIIGTQSSMPLAKGFNNLIKNSSIINVQKKHFLNSITSILDNAFKAPSQPKDEAKKISASQVLLKSNDPNGSAAYRIINGDQARRLICGLTLTMNPISTQKNKPNVKRIVNTGRKLYNQSKELLSQVQKHGFTTETGLYCIKENIVTMIRASSTNTSEGMKDKLSTLDQLQMIAGKNAINKDLLEKNDVVLLKLRVDDRNLLLDDGFTSFALINQEGASGISFESAEDLKAYLEFYHPTSFQPVSFEKLQAKE